MKAQAVKPAESEFGLRDARLGTLIRADFKHAHADYMASPTSFHRRVLVFTAISLVSAYTYSARKRFASTFRVPSTAVPLKDIPTLLAESAVLGDDGRVTSRPVFHRLHSDIRFTYGAWVRQLAVPGVDFNGRGWRALRATIAVRNRLTHPKLSRDMGITKVEVKRAMRGVLWFMSMDLAVTIRFADVLARDFPESETPLERARRKNLAGPRKS